MNDNNRPKIGIHSRTQSAWCPANLTPRRNAPRPPQSITNSTSPPSTTPLSTSNTHSPPPPIPTTLPIPVITVNSQQQPQLSPQRPVNPPPSRQPGIACSSPNSAWKRKPHDDSSTVSQNPPRLLASIRRTSSSNSIRQPSQASPRIITLPKQQTISSSELRRLGRSKSVARCELWSSVPTPIASKAFPLRVGLPFGAIVYPCTSKTTASELLKFLCSRTADLAQRRVVVETPIGFRPSPDLPLLSSCSWISSCIEMNVIPNLIIGAPLSGARTKTSVSTVKRALLSSLTTTPSVLSASASSAISSSSLNINEINYTLQIRIIVGSQVLNTTCKWSTTFQQIKESIAPNLLQSIGKKIKAESLSIKPPKAIETSFSANLTLITSFSFAELCRRHRCIPHVNVSDIPPKGGKTVFCDFHNSDCYIVENAGEKDQNPARHYPVGNAYTHIDAEIDVILGRRKLQDESNDEEYTEFQNSMQRVRFNVGKKKEWCLPTLLCSNPRQIDPNSTEPFLASVSLPLRQVVKTMPIPSNISADAFLEGIINKYYSNFDCNPSQFILKVKGVNSYIYGLQPVLSFSSIQTALVKKTRPDLIVTDRPTEVPNSFAFELFSSIELLEIKDEGPRFVHEEISTSKVPWRKRVCISAWDISHNLRIKLHSSEGFPTSDSWQYLCIVAGLYHGGENLCPEIMSCSIPYNVASLSWNEWIEFDLSVCRIPKDTRICFTFYGRHSKTQLNNNNNNNSSKSPDDQCKDESALGWVACPLYDFRRELKTGRINLVVWQEGKANPIGIAQPDLGDSLKRLSIEFESYSLPVVYPTSGSYPSTFSAASSQNKSNIDQQVESIITKDSLYQLNPQEKQLIWSSRDIVRRLPNSLPKVLQSLDYRNPNDVVEAHKLLQVVEMTPVDAVELLEAKYADEEIRKYAIQRIRSMHTDDLLDCLLQMTQALKYESYHRSCLAELLIERGLKDHRVCHELYWSLRSGLCSGDSRVRSGLLLESLLRGCGENRNSFIAQEAFLDRLHNLAKEVKALKDSERLEYLQKTLKATSFPPRLPVPINPEFLAGGIVVEKCGYKDSSKLPLYIVLKNAEEDCEPLHFIFKEGDDLRQDALTLQMIRIMDKLWQNAGLDLEMSPYRTIAVGATSGFIEVVLNAKTTAEIHRLQGGASAAFRQDPLANWLKSSNPAEPVYQKCVKRFVLSCAGYVVATYVLGISDRHNDNIMLTRDGRLFHIDFGHFLGHKKTFIGINREPAPFVFTPDYAYVMGGKGAPDFEVFADTACKAYMILRSRSSTFINLFALMLSTGIPELQSIQDINYLREAFALDMSPSEACGRFRELIFTSLATWTTRLNNAIHIVVH